MLRNNRFIACIIAGGGGTRFWPLSTPERPKQYLKLISEKSLLQGAYERLCQLFSEENVYIITTQPQVELVKEQLSKLGDEHLIIEPELRDTCPAISYFTMLMSRIRGKDSIVGIFPADHHIPDVKSFGKTLETAFEAAMDGKNLVTVGIKPEFASTQYGYIEKDELISGSLSRVKRFYEKPKQETADRFFKSDQFLWNSGIFVWNASLYLEELKTHSLEHYSALMCIFHHYGHEDFDTVIKERYTQLPKTSVDYAVMEKTRKINVIEAKFRWSDIGSWKSLYEFVVKDSSRNHVRGKVKLKNCSGSIVINETQGWLVLSDLKDSVVVCSDAGMLCASLSGSDSIKDVVKEIK